MESGRAAGTSTAVSSTGKQALLPSAEPLSHQAAIIKHRAATNYTGHGCILTTLGRRTEPGASPGAWSVSGVASQSKTQHLGGVKQTPEATGQLKLTPNASFGLRCRWEVFVSDVDML